MVTKVWRSQTDCPASFSLSPTATWNVQHVEMVQSIMTFPPVFYIMQLMFKTSVILYPH